jgi:protein TonB
VGGNLKPPKLIQSVTPDYPEIARNARITGIVIIEAQVGTDGRVKTATVLRGIPLLDEQALAAVRQWRYQPLLLNGIPVDFILTVTVNFNLTGGSAS